MIVIGAGLSGLMAAGCASRSGARVALLEKNALPGRKYAFTSMGKGALANTAPPIEHFHGRDARFVADALAALPAADLAAWFEAHGAPLSPGLHFGLLLPSEPDQALSALVRGLEGAEFMPETRATAGKAGGKGFQVVLDDGRKLACSRLVLACGGPNLPQCGGETMGLEIAQKFGHCVKAAAPQHVGFATPEIWLRGLAGLWMDVRASLAHEGDVLGQTTGSLLFTNSGLTGQAVFDVSHLAAPEFARGRKLELAINFFPAESPADVEQWLFRTLGGQTRVRAVEALEDMLPLRLAAALLARQKVKAGARVDSLGQPQRQGLLREMLDLRVRLDGTLGMQAAEDFCGGVNVREIDPRTFESRKVPGLYVVGRMLDISADWGGFRQHLALASGLLAGRHAGLHLDSGGRAR